MPRSSRNTHDLGARTLALGLAASAAAVGAFLLLQRSAWPPHEDETLALFVGRSSLGELLETVHGERGGAPLHFLLAWLVGHAGGGLTELRLLSTLFAVVSVPLVGLLAARLAGRIAGLATAVLVSGSWILLFHGIYARMYSLFLATSALSYLALLYALRQGGRRAWALWVLAVLVTVSTHPYGAIVLATQVVFFLVRRERVREGLIATAAVAVFGIPFWYTDLVLAGRFDVGVGGGGAQLGSPLEVLDYLGEVAGDFTTGWLVLLPVVLALAAIGAFRLARAQPRSALLVAVVLALPTGALALARLGDTTSPESRHLIFALPFFTLLVAQGALALPGRRTGRAAAVLAVAALLVGEVAWARHKTPPLFEGEPNARIQARSTASAWLAETSRSDDVLFGYEPLYLGAWERSRRLSRTIVPRADASLALGVLRGAREPLGRGVWVFDASKRSNITPRSSIPVRLPSPRRDFEARAFGPYLIIRTKEPAETAQRYLQQASQVMLVGKALLIGDADVNFVTVRRAAYRLERASSRSLSSSSR